MSDNRLYGCSPFTQFSLHEPDVYVIAKGKDHKQYEYGNKVSIVSTKDNNIIVGF
jgi:IS5 family transposase